VTTYNLAHSFTTFNTCYKDTGLFGIYMVAPDNKLNDLMWYTMDNMVRLCHNVTDAEVDRAKTQLKVCATSWKASWKAIYTAYRIHAFMIHDCYSAPISQWQAATVFALLATFLFFLDIKHLYIHRLSLSSISHPFLTHLSPISHPSLTHLSPISHPSLTHLSPISHPSLTHLSSISHPCRRVC
jgi:hypothetical protein